MDDSLTGLLHADLAMRKVSRPPFLAGFESEGPDFGHVSPLSQAATRTRYHQPPGASFGFVKKGIRTEQKELGKELAKM
jgi:hypothetical protein